MPAKPVQSRGVRSQASEVAQMAVRLRFLQGIGKASLKADPDRQPKNAAVRQDGETFAGPKLGKLRLFATRISKAELAQINALFKRHGKVVRETALLYVFSVKSQHRRLLLLNQAIKEGWSSRQLKHACSNYLKQRSPREVGRLPTIGKTSSERRRHLAGHCATFLRFCKALQEANKEDKDKVPQNLLGLMYVASTEVARLRAVALRP